jgi:hypothetical protein
MPWWGYLALGLAILVAIVWLLFTLAWAAKVGDAMRDEW